MIKPASNDLLFVGAGHQRIYSRHRAAMSKCGIDIRARSRKLYLNYRTTDEIRRLAVALLEGCDVDDLDDGHDETRRYKSLSHGPVPLVLEAADMQTPSWPWYQRPTSPCPWCWKRRTCRPQSPKRWRL